ncbi:BcpI immunity protein (plasmid) [Phocaeicola vulgatus]|nr:BcpI immunity protein [Phocaeicola vulgatus]
MKKKYLIFLVLSFCLFSSCSTMLEIITGNYKCAYPNCNERATENSVYCPYHKPYYLK